MRKVYPYTLLDVFTDQIFGGNQLAVFTQAEGLSDEQMQKIANEMNLMETTFVLEGETEKTPRVRIFTTADEMPFAGHPTIGSAICLAINQHCEGQVTDWELQENVGPVPVTVDGTCDVFSAELTTAVLPELSASALNREQMATLLSLPVQALISAPKKGNCGAPFTLIELKDKTAVDNVQIQSADKSLLFADDDWPAFYFFCRDGHKLYARMICQEVNLVEDPATGSAAAALSGYLAHSMQLDSGIHHFVIDQGVSMGRPATIGLSISVAEGQQGLSGVEKVTVSGQAVVTGEGYLKL